jgi:hypothetical protein
MSDVAISHGATLHMQWSMTGCACCLLAVLLLLLLL